MTSRMRLPVSMARLGSRPAGNYGVCCKAARRRRDAADHPFMRNAPDAMSGHPSPRASFERQRAREKKALDQSRAPSRQAGEHSPALIYQAGIALRSNTYFKVALEVVDKSEGAAGACIPPPRIAGEVARVFARAGDGKSCCETL